MIEEIRALGEDALEGAQVIEEALKGIELCDLFAPKIEIESIEQCRKHLKAVVLMLNIVVIRKETRTCAFLGRFN